MDFRIADTFTDSLPVEPAKSRGPSRRSLSICRLNPTNPGLSFHKFDKGKVSKHEAVHRCTPSSYGVQLDCALEHRCAARSALRPARGERVCQQCDGLIGAGGYHSHK